MRTIQSQDWQHCTVVADPALGQDDEGLGLIRPLDDLDLHARQSSSDGGLKLRPSIAAVSKEPGQERKGAEQGRHQRGAASLSVTTPPGHRVSISEIYNCLKREEGYAGSYGAVRDYLRFRFTARQASTQDVWEQLYEEIVSVSKKDAISLLQSL